MNIDPIFITIAMVVAAAWTLPWKAVALWKAARAGAKVWFVALLLINTVGLLEILYIFIFSKQSRVPDAQLKS